MPFEEKNKFALLTAIISRAYSSSHANPTGMETQMIEHYRNDSATGEWLIDAASEATTGDDGVMPVVHEKTWPLWIGAARSHLLALVESAEKARK